MKRLFALTLLVCVSAGADLVPADQPWKKTVAAFAREHLKHSAWGVTHSERNYALSLELAREAGLQVDTDVLFAAAYLHDMGGFPEFEKEGVDHAVRSAELVEGILVPAGFPAAKLDAVRGTILAHTYYNAKAPQTPEEIVFHDADVLDFLGIIGFARIVSLTERDPVAADLKGAFQVLKTFPDRMTQSLYSEPGRSSGRTRAAELRQALQQLDAQSFSGKAL